MTSQTLDGMKFAAALRSGIHRVIHAQEQLNQINVFPVADGDTGTNLSLSLSASLNVLDSRDDTRLDSLLVRVADALLDGARGNSGAIMAQFFQGLSDAAENLATFGRDSLTRAMSLGSEYAHDAIGDPKPGTILSVIQAFAHSMASQPGGASEDLPKLLNSALDDTQKALEATRDQLEANRKAGVVDAGAKGFVLLMEGVCDYVATGKETEKPAIADLLTAADEGITAGADGDVEFRYCTECMVNGEDIDRRKLREALSSLGNSLVLAGSKKKAKIHIHVDNPEEVFRLAGNFGEVSGQKADDMRQQVASSHQAASRFAVITDSAADLADEEIERLDIHVVPLRIQFGDRGYLDKVSISPDEFFAMQASGEVAPTTSQPAPGDFRRQFQFLASHHNDVIAISLTGTVSGTLRAAETAAGRVAAAGAVHVFDSLNASSGQGQLVVYAAERAAAGASAAETLKELEVMRAKTWSFALVDDFDYAVKGGRVPGWVKTVTRWLHVTPVLVTTPGGRIRPGGVVTGRNDKLPGFIRFMLRRLPHNGPLRITIGHAICADKAERLKSMLEEADITISRMTICELGSALGVHGGPGTLVVGIQAEPEVG